MHSAVVFLCDCCYVSIICHYFCFTICHLLLSFDLIISFLYCLDLLIRPYLLIKDESSIFCLFLNFYLSKVYLICPLESLDSLMRLLSNVYFAPYNAPDSFHFWNLLFQAGVPSYRPMVCVVNDCSSHPVIRG